jgi:hypothetical protein
MVRKIKNKRGQATIHIIVGIMLIGGGLAYLLGQPILGGLIASISLVIEIAVNYARNLI